MSFEDLRRGDVYPLNTHGRICEKQGCAQASITALVSNVCTIDDETAVEVRCLCKQHAEDFKTEVMKDMIKELKEKFPHLRVELPREVNRLAEWAPRLGIDLPERKFVDYVHDTKTSYISTEKAERAVHNFLSKNEKSLRFQEPPAGGWKQEYLGTPMESPTGRLSEPFDPPMHNFKIRSRLGEAYSKGEPPPESKFFVGVDQAAGRTTAVLAKKGEDGRIEITPLCDRKVLYPHVIKPRGMDVAEVALRKAEKPKGRVILVEKLHPSMFREPTKVSVRETSIELIRSVVADKGQGELISHLSSEVAGVLTDILRVVLKPQESDPLPLRAGDRVFILEKEGQLFRTWLLDLDELPAISSHQRKAEP
jgi:hypothetical protein